MKLEFATLNSNKGLTTSANTGSDSSSKCPAGWTEKQFLGITYCVKDKH